VDAAAVDVEISEDAEGAQAVPLEVEMDEDEASTVVEASVATVVDSVATAVDSVVTAVAEVGFAETVVEVGSVVDVADLKLPKSSGKSCPITSNIMANH
jgi:hypothetical protein